MSFLLHLCSCTFSVLKCSWVPISCGHNDFSGVHLAPKDFNCNVVDRGLEHAAQPLIFGVTAASASSSEARTVLIDFFFPECKIQMSEHSKKWRFHVFSLFFFKTMSPQTKGLRTYLGNSKKTHKENEGEQWARAKTGWDQEKEVIEDKEKKVQEAAFLEETHREPGEEEGIDWYHGQKDLPENREGVSLGYASNNSAGRLPEDRHHDCDFCYNYPNILHRDSRWMSG